MSTPTAVQLDAPSIERLSAARFTYSQVGATRGELPPDTDHQRAEVVVGHGRPRFEQCADAVLSWEVQTRAGMTVAASHLRVRPGAVVRVGIGTGPLRIAAPARVVYVVEDTDRVGFAYGTLAGHPVAGEELFAVHLRPDGAVVFGVLAFSRPATALARLAGPLGGIGQRLAARRYLSGMRSLPQ